MLKKIRIILVLVSLSATLCVMSNTFSRYVAATVGDVEVSIAKWKILLNSEDITNSEHRNVSITPIIYENENIASGVVAPSSSGYFDIIIDPTNVDLSFNYNITLGVNNQNLSDLIIKEYAILPSNNPDDTSVQRVQLENNRITNTMTFDKNVQSFKFTSFIVRVYFEWREGNNEQMNDQQDTAASYSQNGENNTFNITANISFEQAL